MGGERRKSAEDVLMTDIPQGELVKTQEILLRYIGVKIGPPS